MGAGDVYGRGGVLESGGKTYESGGGGGANIYPAVRYPYNIVSESNHHHHNSFSPEQWEISILRLSCLF